MPKFNDYITIKRAADFLGVSPNTLRNWGASGKLNEHRNPINGYRLYRVADLEKLLKALDRSVDGKPRGRRVGRGRRS
jgi:DNA-binding transcriptional MerR regulator